VSTPAWVQRLVPQPVLGPVLRYVGKDDATVWVETDTPCVVDVLGHRDHPSRSTATTDYDFPQPVIRTLGRGGPLQLVSGPAALRCHTVRPSASVACIRRAEAHPRRDLFAHYPAALVYPRARGVLTTERLLRSVAPVELAPDAGGVAEIDPPAVCELVHDPESPAPEREYRAASTGCRVEPIAVVDHLDAQELSSRRGPAGRSAALAPGPRASRCCSLAP
jgi:hypothetical protein